uniref:Reverse transcriptase domain-containing protein n=1 Tax=Cannabis sativa TaxID=3483 RepID=A0A803P3Y4_CANSA
MLFDTHDKQVFLDTLSGDINLCSGPWALVGDLNVLLLSEDKSGGRTFVPRDGSILRRFLFETGGVDLGFFGCKFTWKNKRQSGGLIRERLDRALVDTEWINLFPRGGVRNLPILSSDHDPILFDSVMERSRGSTPFKFYEAWFKEGSCLEIIQQAWTSSGSIDSNENISRRFDAIRASTMVRRKRNFIWSLKNDLGFVVFKEKEKGEVLNNYFKRTGKIPSSLNHTFICLIPKCENPNSVEKFRPIALCNFVYKVSAFVPGRWIAESSLLTQELVHTIKSKRGKGGLMAIKIDVNKAYDRLEWKFIKKVLEVFGFHSHFITLVMNCITFVSYSILFNGRPLKKFFPQRGIRQGDPMSPFLFILCNEVFSRLIAKEQSLGRVNGIRIAREAPAISHLMFADDIILFCRANEKEVESLVNCMMIYESWSGQQCSKLKSGVLFSKNCSQALQRILMDKLGIGLVKREEKHLGNPFLFSRSRKKDFNFLKSNLCKRLEGWCMKTLSTIGRMVTINSVAMALPTYTMSTCKIPITYCKEFDSLVKKFWWKGRIDNSRFLATKTWDVSFQKKVVEVQVSEDSRM